MVQFKSEFADSDAAEKHDIGWCLAKVESSSFIACQAVHVTSNKNPKSCAVAAGRKDAI